MISEIGPHKNYKLTLIILGIALAPSLVIFAFEWLRIKQLEILPALLLGPFAIWVLFQIMGSSKLIVSLCLILASWIYYAIVFGTMYELARKWGYRAWIGGIIGLVLVNLGTLEYVIGMFDL